MTEQIKHRSEKEDRQLDAMIQGLQLTHAAFDRMCDSLSPIVATARQMAYPECQAQSQLDEIPGVHHQAMIDTFPKETTSSK
jgi:hypothetical protein